MKTLNNISILIRGGGDIASGVAYNLHKSGLKVIILEISKPLTVRRKVAFGSAATLKEMTVENVKSVLAENYEKIEKILSNGNIPVLIDSLSHAINFLHPDVIVDATIAKRNTGIKKNMAPLTIGLGPGFTAKKDTDLVIETNRGENLGKIFYEGTASQNTGMPANFMGKGKKRVLRASENGRIKHVLDIEEYVKENDIICYVNDIPIRAPFDGTVRGLIMNNRLVHKGLKIGDVDPRIDKECCRIISDKAHIIGKAVLKAINELS